MLHESAQIRLWFVQQYRNTGKIVAAAGANRQIRHPHPALYLEERVLKRLALAMADFGTHAAFLSAKLPSAFACLLDTHR
jgi:hypothetical protein